MNELLAKIEDYRKRIADEKLYLAGLDQTTTFGSISSVEANARIKDYEQRIENLKTRIRGEREVDITEEQLRAMEYVLSAEYDND